MEQSARTGWESVRPLAEALGVLDDAMTELARLSNTPGGDGMASPY
jgi:hypothetical protein